MRIFESWTSPKLPVLRRLGLQIVLEGLELGRILIGTVSIRVFRRNAGEVIASWGEGERLPFGWALRARALISEGHYTMSYLGM